MRNHFSFERLVSIKKFSTKQTHESDVAKSRIYFIDLLRCDSQQKCLDLKLKKKRTMRSGHIEIYKRCIAYI